MITPGEHRRYLRAFREMPGVFPDGELITVISQTGVVVACRNHRGQILGCLARELYDPNDARGYPPLEEDATEAPPT